MRRAWPITPSGSGSTCIAMPDGTLMVKIENTRRHGAGHHHRQMLEECFAFVTRMRAAAILIHPYDDH